MTAEELLQEPYNPDNWSLARDMCNEIIERYTQTFPVYLLPMPDDTEDNMWTKRGGHKKTLLKEHRYKANHDEQPHARTGIPTHDDAIGWNSFLEHQQYLYWLKEEYQDSGEPEHLLTAFLYATRNGYNPPLWVLDHWLFPAFCDFSAHKGQKTLEQCLGLAGTQRAGNLFDKRDRKQKIFYIRFQMHNLISSTGLSITKCSEILSMKPGLPAPATIATMYKKGRDQISKEISSMAFSYEELNKKLGENDTNNPFKNADLPLKVFEKHGEAFHAAAESNRADITVTPADYAAFLQKVKSHS